MEIEIPKDKADYMYNFVKSIVDEIGPRMSCSPQEAEAAEYIKEEFKKVCDEVKLEPFTCHPKAFLGWIKLVVSMVVISMILYLVMQFFSDYFIVLIFAIISFLLVGLPFWIMWQEFFNYKEFIDPLFKKKSSQNVIGILNPEGEVKKVIIFGSHIDSAIEFRLQKVLGFGFIPLAFGGIIIMLLWLILSLINLVVVAIGLLIFKGLFFNLVIWLIIIGVPCYIGLFFFVPIGNKGNVVPGSVDNLSSCAVVQGLARYLVEHKDIIPANTEIRFISFGCEEAGLRGAYRYVTAHKEELLRLDAELVNMDGLETPNMFHAIEFEPTTRTWHSEEVTQRLVDASKDLGLNITRFGAGKLEKTLGRLSGGSDAAAFSKAGIKAGFINSADWKTRSSYYHQAEDTPDKIRPGTLETAMKICLAYILRVKNKK
ncbi:MAG: M28 family peptidase [Promethearchaeota archaeon]